MTRVEGLELLRNALYESDITHMVKELVSMLLATAPAVIYI